MATKATLHERVMHEIKEFAILTVYLYITLGAVIMMKTAVLHTDDINFTPWGIAIVKAMVLAKFMLLGNALKLGEGHKTSPLIWPTLHKAFAFLVLLIILTVIEEAVVGLFHHRSVAASLGDLFGPAAPTRDRPPARVSGATRNCSPALKGPAAAQCGRSR